MLTKKKMLVGNIELHLGENGEIDRLNVTYKTQVIENTGEEGAKDVIIAESSESGNVVSSLTSGEKTQLSKMLKRILL